ncbi:FAD-dependent monooxygenase [Streptomyces sp. ISID311]|uniref:FAD-dependent monooxygenase n=1 Tax=Streptomyces sp. ISID311 TaxID=2601673 RepID=UPI0023EE8D41|nr:FAD-dependent monooxygenase [Streptomyces sp. ISID311]
MERTSCCIAGGGPAGMMLGLLLARAGVEVTVLEKHGDFLRDFRGDTVHPSTLRLLDELGLGEAFARLPFAKLREMRAQIGDTTVVMGDMRHLPGRHKYLAMVPQWDFLDLLARAAAEEPHFTLRMHTKVTGLRTTDGRVTGVRFVDEHGTPGELAAALTVACDGRDSMVRAAAGLRQQQFEVPMDVWQVRVDAPPSRGTPLPTTSRAAGSSHGSAAARPRSPWTAARISRRPISSGRAGTPSCAATTSSGCGTGSAPCSTGTTG